MNITLIEQVRDHSKTIPNQLALAFKDEQVCYSDLYRKIEGIGSALLKKGIKRNDRVLFSATSKPEMAAVYLGIQYAGGIAVFLDKNATTETIAAIYEDCDANLLLTDRPIKNLPQQIAVHSLRKLYKTAEEEEVLPYVLPSEEDIAEMIFTTGTTGKPKGVKLSYRAVRNILLNTIEGIGITKQDVLLMALPLNHSLGLRDLRAYLWLGAPVILQNGFTFINDVVKNLDQYHCTGMTLVPATAAKIRVQMEDSFSVVLNRLRYIEVGAGSLTIAQRKELPRLLPDVRIINTWGSSECGGAIFLHVNEVYQDMKKISALGKPLPSVLVRALDEAGNEITPTQVQPGKLSVKGGMIMSGYWNRPELSAETIVDGWLLTNDLVYFEDGFIYMLGRADDIINVGGEKVSPIEIENAAGQYPGIYECACAGVPDPEEILGQVPVLFYVTNDENLSVQELNAFLVEQLERYKLPKHYIRVDEIPRNTMKKIDRKGVRHLWDERDRLLLKNPVIQNILSRRSIRKFTDKPISKEIIDVILEAGYSAPSGHNMQTWQFTVLEKQESIQKLKKAMRIAAEEKNVHFYGFENPQFVVLVSNDVRNHDGCQDASCAAENMFLAANSYGIGSCWVNALMTLRNVEPAKSVLDELGIPENHTVWCSAVFGYPAASGNKMAKKTNNIKYVDRSLSDV